MKLVAIEFLMVYYPSEDSFLTLDVCRYAVRLINAKSLLDMGCGTGFIGINIWKEFKIDVTFSDIDESALEETRSNCKKEGMNNATILKSDLFSAISRKFDLVCFNAPYLPGKRENNYDIVGGSIGNELLYAFLKEIPNFSRFAVITYSSLSNFSLLHQFSELFKLSKKLDFEELY
ncbi:MAG: methyltransferase, partial [Conexivisphaerales archaeon]